MGWIKPIGPFCEIREVPGREGSIEPVRLYAERYLRPVSGLCAAELQDPHRYVAEVFSEFKPGTSVLVFGSGHSYNSNVFYDALGCFRITAWDFVPEAAVGLYPEIEFFSEDILTGPVLGKHDYVFTSHTIEHFTRGQILNTIFPALFGAAKKALVVIVPYGDNWADEKTHKSRFYENDELAAMSSKYKLIRDGVELVYWIDKGFRC